MLCLQSATNPEWIEVAKNNVIPILMDHAHCERKAALNAVSMIARYPERAELVKEMIGIMREEMEHFELVFQELQRQGVTLTRDRGDIYAQKLTDCIRKNEPGRMLDFLLVDAIIEARSCERFSILSKCEEVPEHLRQFFHSLLASEAGHFRTYTDIARLYFPEAEVRSRLQELSEQEADIVRNLPNEAKMHG